MPRHRIKPGDSLNKAISAADWNAMLDLLNHRDKAGLWAPSSSGGFTQPTRVPRASVVWVRNSTGSHLPQFSIVGIDGPAVDASVTYGNFQREVAIDATTPTNSHRGKFAVTCDAIPAGQCGWACVDGFVQAKVDIDHEDHQFCEVANGNISTLQSAFVGSAEIVWRKEDSGDGTWCLVRLGNQRTMVRKATAGASIAAGASGSVAIQDNGSSSESVTAYYTWGDDGGATIDSGDEIFVVWMEDERKWFILPPAVAGSSTTVPTCILFNGNAYNGDSSNKNYLKRHNTDSSQTRVGYEHFINGWGDLAGVGCDMMATASSVGAGTHAHTDASFKLTQGGLYRFILSYDWTDDTTQPSYTTSTLTTSGASAGTAHTHTVDVRVEHSFYSRIKAALQWRNTGGGAWQTTQFQMAGWGDECRFCTDDGIFDSTYANGRDQFVFWQNHDQADREYRILLTLFGSYDSATTPPLIRVIEADSATLAITRLADYAADQTLTP
jgi:hypothetical protein